MKTCYKVVHSYKIYQCLHRAGHEFGFCWTNPVNKALNWRSLQPRTMVKLQFRLNLNEGYFKFTIKLTLASNCKTLLTQMHKNTMVVFSPDGFKSLWINMICAYWCHLTIICQADDDRRGRLCPSYHVLPLVHLLSTHEIDSFTPYCVREEDYADNTLFCLQGFVGKMHPWSKECLNSEKNVSLLLAKSSLSTILTSSLGLLSLITFTFHLFDLSWQQSAPNGKWNKTLYEWFQRLRRHI